MSEEDFSNELKVWALEHFGTMATNAVWRPESTGCRYRKLDDETLELEHRVDHPDSESHHERITGLFASVNINMVDSDVMVTSVALSAEESYRMEMQERQAIAASWTHDCGQPLANMPLSLGVPIFVGEREVLLDDGQTRSVEDWAVSVQCDNCDSPPVLMNPDDYNLLAGDGLFMRYKKCVDDDDDDDDDEWMVAMTREQMYATAEAGELGVLVGSRCPDTGEKVPPWMWGTYCKQVPHEVFAIASLGEEE